LFLVTCNSVAVSLEFIKYWKRCWRI